MTKTIRRQGVISVCLFLGLGLALAAAEDEGAKKPAARKEAARSTAPLKLPEGAVQTAPGTYTYTDAQGKKWTYRATPFGLAKFEEQNAARPAPPPSEKELAQITAVEDGDFIRFERPGPFGTYRWKQKKTELNALEQAAWDRLRARRAAQSEKE